jgi:phage baseplate assembly protein W
MAIVRLDNITKPRQLFSEKNNTESEYFKEETPVYIDLNLDLKLKNIRNAPEGKYSGDIQVSNNMAAIQNSIKNIFTTKKGQKIYDPEFGASLEQYLFESVDEFYAKVIGEEILKNLETFEPRIRVLKIQVTPIPDDNEYRIVLFYEFLQLRKNEMLTLRILNNGEIVL